MQTDLSLDRAKQEANKFSGINEKLQFEEINKIKYTKKIKCIRCGGPHKANNPNCKAKEIKCNLCHKVDNFVKYCLNKKKASYNNKKEINTVKDINISKTSKFIRKVLFVNNCEISFLVDTGCITTLIN